MKTTYKSHVTPVKMSTSAPQGESEFANTPTFYVIFRSGLLPEGVQSSVMCADLFKIHTPTSSNGFNPVQGPWVTTIVWN